MGSIHLQAGAELQNGKYRIERVLGQGGFGITYLAVNTLFDRKVAIKEFFPKDYCDRDATTSHITIGTTLNTELVHKLKEKFLREARNIARLDNDNIVSVYDVFEENDTAYYVMQYIEGETLKELVDREGPMTESQALGYFIPVARAVEYMHSRRMNHLDIKPANIMVRNADGVPMLIDFGSSKQYDKEGDATSSMMPGLTHGYAPMEQYRPGGVAQFTPQSDVYALGATLLFLLTGRKPPHYSEIMEEGLPALPDGVSQQTRLAIEHAMKPRKLDRPESIPQFLAELLKKSLLTTIRKSKINDDKNLENRDAEKTILVYEPKIINLYGQECHHEWADLGLPTLWATTDIGATKAGGKGESFLWGDPTGQKTRKAQSSFITKWFGAGPTVNHISGNSNYDTASCLWGGNWRMPTIEEVEQLNKHCQWYTENGIIYLKGSTGAIISFDRRWRWTADSPKGRLQPFVWVVEDGDLYLNFPSVGDTSWVDLVFPIRPVMTK